MLVLETGKYKPFRFLFADYMYGTLSEHLGFYSDSDRNAHQIGVYCEKCAVARVKVTAPL